MPAASVVRASEPNARYPMASASLDAAVPAIAEHLADVDRADHMPSALDAAILDGGIGAVAGTARMPGPDLVPDRLQGSVVR